MDICLPVDVFSYYSDSFSYIDETWYLVLGRTFLGFQVFFFFIEAKLIFLRSYPVHFFVLYSFAIPSIIGH